MFSRISTIDELISMTKRLDEEMCNLSEKYPDYSSMLKRSMAWNRRFRGSLINVRFMTIEKGYTWLSPKTAEDTIVFKEIIVPDLDGRDDIRELDNVFVDKCIIHAWYNKYNELLDSVCSCEKDGSINDTIFYEPLNTFKDLFAIYYYSKYSKYAVEALQREYTLEKMLCQEEPCKESAVNKAVKLLDEFDKMDRFVFINKCAYIKLVDYPWELEETGHFQRGIKAYQDIPKSCIGSYTRAIVDVETDVDEDLTCDYILLYMEAV